MTFYDKKLMASPALILFLNRGMHHAMYVFNTEGESHQQKLYVTQIAFEAGCCHGEVKSNGTGDICDRKLPLILTRLAVNVGW